MKWIDWISIDDIACWNNYLKFKLPNSPTKKKINNFTSQAVICNHYNAHCMLHNRAICGCLLPSPELCSPFFLSLYQFDTICDFHSFDGAWHPPQWSIKMCAAKIVFTMLACWFPSRVLETWHRNEKKTSGKYIWLHDICPARNFTFWSEWCNHFFGQDYTSWKIYQF